MKKNFFLLILTLSINSSIAQCSLTFADLDKCINYTFSDFDTFALKKGYSFNSEKNVFFCDVAFKEGANLALLRSETEGGYNLIQHIFFLKQSYLDYKEFLELNGRLFKTDTDNKTLTLQYLYENRLVMLQMKTLNSTAVYFIYLSNEKLH